MDIFYFLEEWMRDWQLVSKRAYVNSWITQKKRKEEKERRRGSKGLRRKKRNAVVDRRYLYSCDCSRQYPRKKRAGSLQHYLVPINFQSQLKRGREITLGKAKFKGDQATPRFETPDKRSIVPIGSYILISSCFFPLNNICTDVSLGFLFDENSCLYIGYSI